MSKAYWTFALFLFGCIYSYAEDRFTVAHGTFLTWILKNDSHLIVAADSRVVRWDRTDPGDDECKILRLGPNAVFAASGFSSAQTDKGKNVEIADDLARDAFRIYPNDAKQMSAFWAAGAMKALFVVTPKSVLIKNHFLIMGLFAVASSSRIDVWKTDITYDDDKMNGNPTAIESQGAGPFTSGFDEYVTEFWNGTTGRAVQLRNKVKSETICLADYDACMLGGLVEAVEIWAKNGTIGGPVDIAVLRVGQPFKWVRHKQACRKSDPRAAATLKKEIAKAYPTSRISRTY